MGVQRNVTQGNKIWGLYTILIGNEEGQRDTFGRTNDLGGGVDKGQLWQNKWVFGKIIGLLGKYMGDKIVLWQCLFGCGANFSSKREDQRYSGDGIYDNWVLLVGSAFRQIRDFRNSNAFSPSNFYATVAYSGPLLYLYICKVWSSSKLSTSESSAYTSYVFLVTTHLCYVKRISTHFGLVYQ